MDCLNALALLRGGKQAISEWNRRRSTCEEVPDLRGAGLYEACLANANLRRANLRGAVLRRAVLAGSNLQEAILTWATLSDADLSGADLADAVLRGVDLSRANLSKANLARADLSMAHNEGGYACFFPRAAVLSMVDLRGADLRKANLRGAILCGANLSGANLEDADLSNTVICGFIPRITGSIESPLAGANLSGAKLQAANFYKSDLSGANLRMADLARANLDGTDLSGADLSGADLRETDLYRTILLDTGFKEVICAAARFTCLDLSQVRELATVVHEGPSSIDTETLRLSQGRISEAFLRGCGLTPWEILSTKVYEPTMTPARLADLQYEIFDAWTKGKSVINGCFISYSWKDKTFVDKLRDRLIAEGVNVWLDRHDLVAGTIQDQVWRAIQVHHVVILVLSEDSVQSDWVENELDMARMKEKDERRAVLCPVALDDSWGAKVFAKDRPGDPSRYLWRTLAQKLVVDFSKKGGFNEAFLKLLRGLKTNYGPGDPI